MIQFDLFGDEADPGLGLMVLPVEHTYLLVQNKSSWSVLIYLIWDTPWTFSFFSLKYIF